VLLVTIQPTGVLYWHCGASTHLKRREERVEVVGGDTPKKQRRRFFGPLGELNLGLVKRFFPRLPLNLIPGRSSPTPIPKWKQKSGPEHKLRRH